MKWYNWPSYFLTAFSSLLCVSRLLQVRIHSTPGVDGAQPFRLAATGFLFSALPLVCYSLPEDRRIYTAFIQTNSVCCLLPTRWESIWLGPAGCVFIGPVPRPPGLLKREGLTHESQWKFDLQCPGSPPFISVWAMWSTSCEPWWWYLNGCFSIDECWR